MKLIFENFLDEAKWAEMIKASASFSMFTKSLSLFILQNGYTLDLAKWLLVSMVQKNNIRTLNTTDDIRGAQELNKMVIDTLMAVLSQLAF